MAKKVRRVRKPGTQTTTVIASSEQSSATPANGKSRQEPAERFQQEYAYVLRDLRHILILALLMFALLIFLNLILPFLV
jgi:hypothetical protein